MIKERNRKLDRIDMINAMCRLLARQPGRLDAFMEGLVPLLTRHKLITFGNTEEPSQTKYNSS